MPFTPCHVKHKHADAKTHVHTCLSSHHINRTKAPQRQGIQNGMSVRKRIRAMKLQEEEERGGSLAAACLLLPAAHHTESQASCTASVGHHVSTCIAILESRSS